MARKSIFCFHSGLKYCSEKYFLLESFATMIDDEYSFPPFHLFASIPSSFAAKLYTFTIESYRLDSYKTSLSIKTTFIYNGIYS